MLKWFNNHDPQAVALITQIKTRAENLFQTRQMLCTEAVVVTLNKALNGNLSEAQAIAVAAPFSIAMGDSGCVCGALRGAVLACGLFIGDDQPYLHRKRIRKSARQLHDEFKATYGGTCCRVLSRSVRHDRQAHFHHCARLTAGGAEMAASLILYLRPELIRSSNNVFLRKMDTRIGILMRHLLRIVWPKT
jgi:C_GCAxxG_C_C family probable redox protein